MIKKCKHQKKQKTSVGMLAQTILPRCWHGTACAGRRSVSKLPPLLVSNCSRLGSQVYLQARCVLRRVVPVSPVAIASACMPLVCSCSGSARLVAIMGGSRSRYQRDHHRVCQVTSPSRVFMIKRRRSQPGDPMHQSWRFGSGASVSGAAWGGRSPPSAAGGDPPSAAGGDGAAADGAANDPYQWCCQ